MVIVVVNGIIHNVIDMGGFRIYIYIYIYIFFFLRRWLLGLVGQNMEYFLFYEDGCERMLFAYY